jgi:hypothetical protein
VVKEEPEPEQHAIEVYCRATLTEEPYFVEDVRLEALDVSFLAHAFLVPLSSITKPTAGNPPEKPVQVALVQGGPRIATMSLSVLNYLNLQGRAIVVKYLGTAPEGIHHYFVQRIMTLHGPDFEAGLTHQYPER